MTDWDLRRAQIDWDWGTNGLWFDNRAYARQQRLLPDGSIAGPPKEELNAASTELDRVSESTRAELKRWNLLGERLFGGHPPPDVVDQLPAFYEEKQRLAELVAEELGPGWSVRWTDADSTEHICSATEQLDGVNEGDP
jgi:hypothetical protein